MKLKRRACPVGGQFTLKLLELTHRLPMPSTILSSAVWSCSRSGDFSLSETYSMISWPTCSRLPTSFCRTWARYFSMLGSMILTYHATCKYRQQTCRRDDGMCHFYYFTLVSGRNWRFFWFFFYSRNKCTSSPPCCTWSKTFLNVWVSSGIEAYSCQRYLYSLIWPRSGGHCHPPRSSWTGERDWKTFDRASVFPNILMRLKSSW